MKVKSDIASEKASLEQKIYTLISDLKKAHDNINQLKQANDSKTDKLKNVEEANKELLQTLNNYKENNTTLVQEQLDKFKNESLNEKKIQKSVIEFMEQQSNVQTKITKDTKNKSAGAKVTQSSTTKDIKSDIIILLMDSNKKFLDKNKLFPKEKVYIVTCPTINKGHEILQQTNFLENHTIIIHTSVNNIKTRSAEEGSGKLCKLLSSFKTSYPTTKIIVSGITPRKDKFYIAVRTVNQLIRTELEKEELLNPFRLAFSQTTDPINLNFPEVRDFLMAVVLNLFS